MAPGGEPARAPDEVIKRASGRLERPERRLRPPAPARVRRRGDRPVHPVPAPGRLLSRAGRSATSRAARRGARARRMRRRRRGSRRRRPSRRPSCWRRRPPTRRSSGEAAIDDRHGPRGRHPPGGAAGFEATGPFDLGDGTGLPAFEFDGEGRRPASASTPTSSRPATTPSSSSSGRTTASGPEQVRRGRGGAGRGGRRHRRRSDSTVAGWFRDPSYARQRGGRRHRHREDRGGPRRAGRRRGPERARRARSARPPFLSALAEGAGSGPVEAWVALRRRDDQAPAGAVPVHGPAGPARADQGRRVRHR